MVVSFMVAAPFSLGSVVVRFDRTTAPISSVVALVALSATGHQRSTLVPAPMKDSRTRWISSRGPVSREEYEIALLADPLMMRWSELRA